MLDQPSAELILDEVYSALKSGIPLGFQQHVCANAVALAKREYSMQKECRLAEIDRLIALTGKTADLSSLNHLLTKRIQAASTDVTNRELVAHLILTCIEKLEIDQPHYPAFRQLRR